MRAMQYNETFIDHKLPEINKKKNLNFLTYLYCAWIYLSYVFVIYIIFGVLLRWDEDYPY